MRFSASGCFYSLWILKMHLFIIFIFLRSRLTAQVFPGWDPELGMSGVLCVLTANWITFLLLRTCLILFTYPTAFPHSFTFYDEVSRTFYFLKVWFVLLCAIGFAFQVYK